MTKKINHNTKEASDKKSNSKLKLKTKLAVKNKKTLKVERKKDTPKEKIIPPKRPYSFWVARDGGGGLRTYAKEPKEEANKTYKRVEADYTLFDVKFPQDWFSDVTFETGPLEVILDER